jgi:exopolysaccharide production protein ExoZ
MGGDAKSGNLIAIQILRCLAACMVVIFHSDISMRLFSQYYWPDRSWTSHLYFGVDVFFCISGFIMTMLAARTEWADAGTFIINRFARLLPPYWLFTIVIVAVYLVSPHFNMGGLTGDWELDVSRVVKSFLLIPQDKPPVLGLGWTLIHEFLFYYLVTVLIFLRQGQWIAPFLAAIAVVSAALSLGNIKLLYGYGLSPYYVEFFAGALAYRLHSRISSFYPEAQCAIAISLYFGVSALIDPFSALSLVQVFGLGLMGFLLISGTIGVDAKYNLKKFAPARLLARIGDGSYSLYLSHWIVLSFIGKLAAMVPGAPLPFMIAWHVTAIFSAIIFSILFAEYIELPFHKRLLNHLKSGRVPNSLIRKQAGRKSCASIAQSAANQSVLETAASSPSHPQPEGASDRYPYRHG